MLGSILSNKFYKKWVHQLGKFLRQLPSYHESYLLVSRDSLLSYPEETLENIQSIRKEKPLIRVILL